MNLNQLKLEQNTVYNNSDLLKKLYSYKYNALNNYDILLQSNGDTFKQKNYHKLYLEQKKNLNYKIDSTIKKIISQNNSLSANYCSKTLNSFYHPLEGRLNQNSFNSKNYNDINEEMMEVLKKYNVNGKGPYKDETAFEFMKTKEKNIIKNLKESIMVEGQKNIKKLDNNLKMAQADLDDMNNMKRVVDEKEKLHLEKIKGLENEKKQLDEEVGELKELLAAKKNTLNNYKKRNEQSRKNKKKLIEIKKQEMNEKASNNSKLDALNESNDIGTKKVKNNNNNNQNENNDGNKKRKKKNEPGCECIII